MYKHILIATDGSELATRAVAHGVALAKALKAQVTIVTVTERWSAFVLGLESQQGNLRPLEQYEAKAAAAANIALDEASKIAASQDVPCNLVHVPNQPPAEGILATATERGCDLIVVATHGRRGIDRILIGSRATEVLTYSKVPVLIVR
jgi:nucleotide-binding universal stress UspA family protein